MVLLKQIKQLSHEYLDQVIAIRRHLHAHPELSFKEFNTVEFVRNELMGIGISDIVSCTPTGLIALIKGQQPGTLTVALRADLDALPIFESTGKEYSSTEPGVMHACGHDVHTACLLGAAKILYVLRSFYGGTIKLLFQPGEEVLPGGASLMIKAGALQDPAPHTIFAQHVFPDLEVGKVGFRSGMYMASTDELHVRITGKGGHAALVGTYNNPLLVAAALLMALENAFGTGVEHPHPTVLAFGKIAGNGATNVIPEEVSMAGTFRTMNESYRTMCHKRMVEIATTVAKNMGAEVEFNILKGYPFLSNDAQATDSAKAAAEAYLGKENVVELALRMTAEDFSYFSQQLPSCFYRLGTRNQTKGIVSNVHTPTFDVDENALEIGMGLMAYIALNELTKK